MKTHRSLFAKLAMLVLLALSSAAHAVFIDDVDVYQIGDTSTGPVTLSWNHSYDGSEGGIVTALLEIVAEGVDAPGPGLGEQDEVFINGVSLGFLTQQPFFYSLFDISPGPGALGAPQTELSTSVFAIPLASLLVGINLIEVVVDPSNWIVEVETSRLTVRGTAVVPEPVTAALLGLGLLGVVRRRARS